MPREDDECVELAIQDYTGDHTTQGISAWICGDCGLLAADIDKHRSLAHPEMSDFQTVEAACEALTKDGGQGLSYINLIRARNRWQFLGTQHKSEAVTYAKEVLSAYR